MKIIRLQLPGEFMKYIGFEGLFNEIEFVEILNAFQYEQNHFFSLQKIKFKKDGPSNLVEYIKSKFNPKSFQVLDKTPGEIIIIMSQSNPAGFFPIIQPGPWAFLFPIHVSKDLIFVNIISQKYYVSTLLKTLSALRDDFQIVGTSNVNEFNELSESIWRQAIPFPDFTKRQKEIASYAAKNGFFASPKKITAEAIAKKFEISVSAVNKHLRTAENRAMEYFFGKFV